MMPVETEITIIASSMSYFSPERPPLLGNRQQLVLGPAGNSREPPGHYTLLTNDELFYQIIPSEGPDELQSIQRSKVPFFPASTSNLDIRQ